MCPSTGMYKSGPELNLRLQVWNSPQHLLQTGASAPAGSSAVSAASRGGLGVGECWQPGVGVRRKP